MLNYLVVLSGYTLLFMFVGVITDKMINKLYALNHQSSMKKIDRFNSNMARQLNKMIKEEEKKEAEMPKIIYDRYKLINELKESLLIK